MSDPNLSPKHLILAIVIVLVGVSIGSIQVLKHEGPKFRRSALGHAMPTPRQSSEQGEMAHIPAGTFTMGSASGKGDEQPLHKVAMHAFWMDKTEVTNAEFEKFVKETGYLTMAERAPDPKRFPGVPREALVAGSVIFDPPAREVPLDNPMAWLTYRPGANWRHPEGLESDLRGRETHPVVQVAWDDAAAYAKWAGKRLPTEAEWEYAARGGLDQAGFVWGSEFRPHGEWRANVWQGRFPIENTAADRFRGTSPVGSFVPNGYGLYDMAGNVWEWCADWYDAEYYKHSPSQNPPGPEKSSDPDSSRKVLRGGSFLCSESNGAGFRPGARLASAPQTGMVHTGFRCVKD